MSTDLQAHRAALHFEIHGTLISVARYGSGHINDSYCAVFEKSNITTRYIVQRINQNVFRNPQALMENIQRVTAHLAAQLEEEIDCFRRVLTLIPTQGRRVWHIDDEGCWWRAYRFIENAHTWDAIQSTIQAFQAAKAFGHFQKMLVNLPPPRLHETIPDFHNTPKRFTALEQAIASDPHGRAILAKTEIDFAIVRRPIAHLLVNANLPERIIHADTKINNVMLDDATGEGICVIDLDTVMPGLSLYDFGDMVRTATSPAQEDERDLAKVTMQLPMFEALVRGYLSSTGDVLTAAERAHLVSASKLLAFEQGIRFLTDFLNGDTYYKVAREDHNVDRCRTQFKLLESIEEQEEVMSRIVEALRF